MAQNIPVYPNYFGSLHPAIPLRSCICFRDTTLPRISFGRVIGTTPEHHQIYQYFPHRCQARREFPFLNNWCQKHLNEYNDSLCNLAPWVRSSEIGSAIRCPLFCRSDPFFCFLKLFLVKTCQENYMLFENQHIC
jgi:hypothetical protein